MIELIAATYTPFDAAGRLMLGVIPRLAAHLAASGVDGVFIGGTTGESLSLTVAERISLADAWVGPAREHGLKLMVHVGASAIADAVALAAHADGLGVEAISAMAPSYFKPATVADLAASEPVAVVHLMADDRPVLGSGLSELVRGRCWFAPLTLAGGEA